MSAAELNADPIGRRVVEVVWTDVRWQAPVLGVLVRRSRWYAPLFSDCSQRFSKTMKHSLQLSSRPSVRGFTLIELLVVIAIIAILAGLIMPAVVGVKKQAKVRLAKAEMNQLASAIKDYEAAYDRYPASKDAEANGNPDFTFSAQAAGASVGKAHEAANAELMQIILDLDIPLGSNEGHRRNPKKTVFLNAKQSVASGPGVDTITTDPKLAGLFRDAWGNPYIITIDLNDDNKCVDAVYKTVGGKGLIKNTSVNPNVWELNAPVMIWSMGPDGQADPNIGPDAGVNRDNILGWTAN